MQPDSKPLKKKAAGLASRMEAMFSGDKQAEKRNLLAFAIDVFLVDYYQVL